MMTRSNKIPTPFVAFAAGLALTLTGLAGVAGIQDSAAFFSEKAKADAEYNIRELQRNLKKDVCVETFKEIPADVKSGVNLADKAAATKMFEDWAAKRARLQSVNGVYMLLVRDPSHLQVAVGNETQKRAFTLADRDALVRTMLTKLRTKDYDGALREGIGFISSTMKSHAPAPGKPVSSSGPVGYHDNRSGSGSSGGWLLPLLILGLIGWLAFAVIRSLFRAGSSIGTGGAPGMAGGGGGGGGGGFMRNVLGGMFGAAAGMWIYDSFFGSRGHSSYGAPPGDTLGGSAGDSGFLGQDTDYSSSGGSFGGDDSGGGFGGGGFGGGDFGGGDSGGEAEIPAAVVVGIFDFERVVRTVPCAVTVRTFDGGDNAGTAPVTAQGTVRTTL